MSATWKLVIWIVAAILFVAEAVRSRSLVAAGLAVFTVPFIADSASAT